MLKDNPAVKAIALLHERLRAWEAKAASEEIPDWRDWRDELADQEAFEAAETILSAAGYDFDRPDPWRRKTVEAFREERRVEKTAGSFSGGEYLN